MRIFFYCRLLQKSVRTFLFPSYSFITILFGQRFGTIFKSVLSDAKHWILKILYFRLECLNLTKLMSVPMDFSFLVLNVSVFYVRSNGVNNSFYQFCFFYQIFFWKLSVSESKEVYHTKNGDQRFVNFTMISFYSLVSP